MPPFIASGEKNAIPDGDSSLKKKKKKEKKKKSSWLLEELVSSTEPWDSSSDLGMEG